MAERVLRVEQAIYEAAFAAAALDEVLFQELHRLICHDLVPDWAGRWRAIEVSVGRLIPPAPHLVALQMRHYGADLQVRWAAAADTSGVLMLEFLAFAEGRFLTIHPFQDFNGRTIRLFLLELLRRLDLPRVVLAPETESEREAYFTALEAADRADWQPLMQIWQQRFINSSRPL